MEGRILGKATRRRKRLQIYKLYFAMTAANNKTRTVKGKEKKKDKNTQHTIVNIKEKKIIKHTN